MKWEFPDSCQTASFQLHARQTPVNTKILNTSLMLFLLLIYNRHQKGRQLTGSCTNLLYPLFFKGKPHLYSSPGVNNSNQTLTLTVQYSQHGPRISQFAPAIWLAESFRLSGKSPAKNVSEGNQGIYWIQSKALHVLEKLMYLCTNADANVSQIHWHTLNAVNKKKIKYSMFNLNILWKAEESIRER